MKRYCLLLMIVAFSSSIFAQNWTKEIQKEFRKSKELAVEVNLSEGFTIMGVSRERFPLIYAGKYHTNEEYANYILERFENKIKDYLFKYTKTKENKNAEFKVVYNFAFITDNAGINGYYYVDYNGNRSAEIPIDIKDGRWNDFETLLMENTEAIFVSPKAKIVSSPFKANLYKY